MTVFVGRTRELQHLERRLESALAGEGGVVFVTGDTGAGKSFLVRRFLVDAALRAPEARVIEGDCSEQYGAGEPYQPFVEALRDLVAGGDKPARARFRDMARQLAPYWLAALPVAGDLVAATLATAVELKQSPRGDKPARARFTDMARQLAPYWLAALPVAGDVVAATRATALELKQSFGGATAMAAPPSEEALFFQYTELLLAAAEEQAVVLFLDDLHWADQASVSLLAHVARKIADKPVLIIGTYRPADVEVSKHPIKQAKLELERYGVAEELALIPLDSTALAEFISEELDGPPTPELVDWLERRAGSNALFFGELLKWLVAQEFARKHHDEWVLARVPEELEIPRSAESAIEKRLNRLDPDLYRVLEYASVEGDEFDSTVLARLLDLDKLDLEETVEPLERVHGLIRLSETRHLPNGDLASVYQFNHSLFQDVLHQNLKGKRRILLHRKIAQIIERIYATDLLAVAHKLAIHYDEGRLRDQAYEFALRAAERAGRLYAHRDAIELLRRGLRNSENEEQQIEVLERLGEENRLARRFPEALSEFVHALEGAEAGDDPHRALRLKRKMVLVERDYGHRSARELLDQLAELAGEARELEARAELCEILWNFHDLPDVEAAHGAAQEALQIAQDLGERARVVRAHYELGVVLMFGEEPAEAIPHLQEALQFYGELPDRHRAGLCHNCLAVVRLHVGQYQTAVEEFSAAAAAFDEVGDPVNEASVRNNLGVLLTRIGDFERAEANLQEALRIARRMDATARLLHPLQNLAELHQAKGAWDAAKENWGRFLELAQEMGYWNDEISARCGLGLVHLQERDLEAVRAELEAARELLSDRDTWPESRDACQLLVARLAAAEGDDEGAIQALEAAEETLAQRDRYEWAESRLLHGEIVGRKDVERAASIIEEALETFRELGAEPMRQRAEALLTYIGGTR